MLASDLRGLGTGAIQKPKKAQYKDELYRAAYKIVGQRIYLSSEYSPVGLSGRVDFRVSSMNWAIECVREGDLLVQHVARFQKGGQYYKWIQDGSITKYIIIDFRTSMPSKIDCKPAQRRPFDKFANMLLTSCYTTSFLRSICSRLSVLSHLRLVRRNTGSIRSASMRVFFLGCFCSSGRQNADLIILPEFLSSKDLACERRGSLF